MDPALCEKIQAETDFQTHLAKVDCYSRLAVLTNNTDMCFEYTHYDSSTECIRSVALKLNDSSICDLEKDNCISLFEK